MKNIIVGLAFSYASNRAYYVPLSDYKDGTSKYLEIFRNIFENETIKKVAHDIKDKSQSLFNYGIILRGIFLDTMIMHYLIDPDQRHTKEKLFVNYLSHPIESNYLYSSYQTDKKSMDFSKFSVKDLCQLKCEEADLVYQLSHILQIKLKELELDKLYSDVESSLISVLSEMESCGVSVDKEGLNTYSKELGIEMANLELEVHQIAGREFNLASPKQLGEILFDELKIGKGKIKKTKTGQYATGEEVIEKLSEEHIIVKKLLEWRQLGKLKSTYVDALPQLIDPNSGRIHTTFNQAVASTGRLSSTNPNLQNIPIRTPRGRRVRELFVAKDSNHVLFSADYSQIELRVIASMSEDKAMQEAFLGGEDIHAKTASKVFNLPINMVSREQRGNAKTINFGIIYGVSAFGLSQQSNLSRTEAKEVIESYFSSYPGIKKYIDEQVVFAREKGFVETLIGRRRYLTEINSPNRVIRGHAERNAVNAPIQGTAADIMKLAMIGVNNRMKKEGLLSKMIIQVHDELVFDAMKSELDDLRLLVTEEMENAFKLNVPLVVDTGFGNNWLDAH